MMRLALLLCTTTGWLRALAAPFCAAPDYAAAMRQGLRPESLNRTVVILGSSTAEGVGASTPVASWAARLARQLAGSAITVLNRSKAGTNTADSLERFDRDVAPYQPAFVILATSIVNEGFAASPQAAFERYLANTGALIARVRQLGAIPVNITMYPYFRYGPDHFPFLDLLARSLEEWGWPLFNFWSPVATVDGRWIPLLSADGLHPLDAGHAAFYDAIPDSLFSSLLESADLALPPDWPGGWRASAFDAASGLLRLSPTRPLSSWTVAAFFRDPAMTEESTLIAVNGDEPIRLSRSFNQLELWVGPEKLLLRAEPAAGWHHLALSYQGLTGRLLLAIDGSVWGEALATPRKQAVSFDLARDCPACLAAQLLLYRTNMHPAELAELAGRRILRRSLEAWAPLNGEADPGSNLNAARTSATVEPLGAWTYDPAAYPPLCPPRPETAGW